MDMDDPADDPDDANLCFSRPCYRAGRKETTVKVYTVNQESRYLVVRNVPALGCIDELVKLFALYGPIEEYRLLDEEECATFTDVYWLKYVHISNARFAKRKLDDYKFLGNILKVTYAPEQESPSETRAKLEERRRIVLRRMAKLEGERTAMSLHAAGCLPSPASTPLDRSEWKHDGRFFPSLASSVDSYPYEPTPLECLPRPTSDRSGSASLYGRRRGPLVGPAGAASRTTVGVPATAEKAKDGSALGRGTGSQVKGSVCQGKAIPKLIGPQKAPSCGGMQVSGNHPGASGRLDSRPVVMQQTTSEEEVGKITSKLSNPKYFQSASMNETVLSVRQKLDELAKVGGDRSAIVGDSCAVKGAADCAGPRDNGKDKSEALQSPPLKKPRVDNRRRI